ncbi:hypothetical protein FB446DRAFT_773443 [Lentinula raphanica]|nr:hypothetical protein FB446DRAFT_773443 [Lentinula raphanica]
MYYTFGVTVLLDHAATKFNLKPIEAHTRLIDRKIGKLAVDSRKIAPWSPEERWYYVDWSFAGACAWSMGPLTMQTKDIHRLRVARAQAQGRVGDQVSEYASNEQRRRIRLMILRMTIKPNGRTQFLPIYQQLWAVNLGFITATGIEDPPVLIHVCDLLKQNDDQKRHPDGIGEVKKEAIEASYQSYLIPEACLLDSQADIIDEYAEEGELAGRLRGDNVLFEELNTHIHKFVQNTAGFWQNPIYEFVQKTRRRRGAGEVFRTKGTWIWCLTSRFQSGILSAIVQKQADGDRYLEPLGKHLENFCKN